MTVECNCVVCFGREGQGGMEFEWVIAGGLSRAPIFGVQRLETGLVFETGERLEDA